MNRTNSYFGLRTRILWRMWRTGKLSFKKIFNAAHCYLAYWLKLKKSAPAPYLINFELWNECNESCVFCRSGDGDIHDVNPQKKTSLPIKKGKLKIEIYKEIIDELKGRLLMAVPYINGEPLLSKDIYAAVRYASENHVATMIATNGMILTEANSKKLLDAGLDFIKIHLSGFTDPVHKIQHRLGSAEVIKKNIRRLVEMNKDHGMLIMLDYISYRHNAHELELAREFANELGIMFNVRPGNPRGMEETEAPQSVAPLPTNVACDWLWTVLTVDWDGSVYPCCDHVVWSGAEAYAKYEVGSTKILQTWNDTKARKMRTIHATQGRTPIPICSECPRQGVTFKW